jgi:pSer/pThr/pTyr-binding forkhead associated (FHA) protein
MPDASPPRGDNERMAEITLRVLDGADRGKVFDALATPVTIGREEGNSIQLNDERVSRFHLKIQTDRDKVVLTDLQSTNGTRVNGEDVQLRILRYGDLITLGRSTLLFGSRDEIAARLRELRPKAADEADTAQEEEGNGDSPGFELDPDWENDPEVQKTLHTLRPPGLPEGLSPGQAAEVSEIIEYVHLRLRELIESATIKTPKEPVALEFEQWQHLLDLQALLAGYLRQIGDPGETMG